MYESREEYRKLVEKKVVLLEWVVGHRVKHGKHDLCPRCRHEGVYDLEGLGFDIDGNSIYYSTVFNEWRCRRCDHHRVA